MAATSLEARVSMRRVDADRVGQHVAARLDGHHDLFQRGVAGALADAVDGAFDLPRAGADAGQRVGHGQAQVVVAVHGEDRLVGVRHRSRSGAEHRAVFLGRGVADGVGQIDGRGAGLDGGLDAAARGNRSSVRVASSARPLDVVDAGCGRWVDRGRAIISSTSLGRLAAACARRWIGEVAMKVWMRGRCGRLHGLAGAIDVGARRRGPGPQRPERLRAAWRSRSTASKSPSRRSGSRPR